MDKLLQKMVEGTVAGMKIIRADQRRPQKPGTAAIKGDQTIVTPTDKGVEKAIHAVLKDIPGTRFHGEEGTASGEGDITLMVDPLDGTRPFAIRLATSTVIVAAVKNSEVVAVVVGDPATGRVWSTEKSKPTMVTVYNYESEQFDEPTMVTVWEGGLGGKKQAVVFTDHSLGFTRSGQRILTDEEVGKLLGRIPTQATLLMPGSNGMNFALVANGSEFMAGQITTAVGGAWDVAPVLLVLQAGGAARAFKKADEEFLEVDPLQIKQADLMVSGNSRETVDALVDLIFAF